MCIDNETYPDVGALMELQDREIVATVRKIFAHRNWKRLAATYPGHSDLELLEKCALQTELLAILEPAYSVCDDDEFFTMVGDALIGMSK